MRLSSDYKRVSLFEAPETGEIEYQHTARKTIDTRFQVGPFVYRVRFDPEGGTGEDVAVDFRLIDIEATDEEFIEMVSRAKRKQVSLKEAMHELAMMVHKNGFDKLGIIGPYTTKIFGAVLNIIKDYVKKYNPRCVNFTSTGEDRTGIYRRLITRAFPGVHVESSPAEDENTEIFRVCSER